MFRKTRNIVYFLGPIALTCFLLGSVFWSYLRTFDSSAFKVDGAYAHTAELTSAQYSGRLAGSEGNRLAMEYVASYFKQIGIEPAGDNNTYYQKFQTMVPSYNSEPLFRVLDSHGNVIREYQYGTEFREDLSSLVGLGDAKGQLYYARENLFSFPVQVIKDKIILLNQVPDLRDIQHALDSGVKGIIAMGEPKKYPADMGSKLAKNLPVVILDPALFQKLTYRDYQNGVSAELKVDVAATFVETANVLGKIPGKGPGFTVIAANLDSLGSDSSGRYFPGAFDGASGVGLMLELAKALHEQKIMPDKTIVFAAWNNQQYGSKGAWYYVQHPLYPLSKSQVIILEHLGAADELNVRALDNLSKMFANVIGGYAHDANAKLQEKNSIMGYPIINLVPFAIKEVPAVAVSDKYDDTPASVIGSYDDDLAHLSQQSLQQAAVVLMNYLRREIYKDYFPDYLSRTEVAVLGVFGVSLLLIYLVFSLHKRFPGLRFGKLRVEDIYYSTFFQLFFKGYFFITASALLFIAVALIANVPRDFNIIYTGGQVYNNFSLFLVIKKTLLYLGQASWLNSAKNGANVFQAIAGPFGRSSLLLFLVILVSSLAGTAKGLRDGFKQRRREALRTLSALAVLSVPDVLIVVLLQLLVTFLYQHKLLFFLDNHPELKTFLVAFLCLAILPTVYISRIAENAALEELKKDYITAAKAKGLPDSYLLKVHLLPSVFIRVLNAMPVVLAQIVSNLIVVEYLLYYPGIVFSLLKSYEQNDTVSFVWLAMSLGLIYILFNACFRIITKVINPFRQGGAL